MLDNQTFSNLLEGILDELSLRIDEGIVDLQNPNHLQKLGEIFDEMELYQVGDQLIENLMREDEDDDYTHLGAGIYVAKRDVDPDGGAKKGAQKYRKDGEGEQATFSAISDEEAAQIRQKQGDAGEKAAASFNQQQAKDGGEGGGEGEEQERGTALDPSTSSGQNYTDQLPPEDPASTSSDEKDKEKGGDKNSKSLTKQEKSEQIDRIDGDVKTQGLEGVIKAPGDPKGGSAVNEIGQGNVLKILQEDNNLSDEEIEKQLCNDVGYTKLTKVHICPIPGDNKKKQNRQSIINAARAKHRRNERLIQEEGLNPDTTTTSHVWGAKQSLENTVDDLCSQNINIINGLPADCNKDNLFVKNSDGSFKLDKNGQKIPKPVEFDEDGNPINYMQVILNGGEGDNPTDTMCVIIDTSKNPPRCEIMHDSDKMSDEDIQGNSGPIKTIEKAREEFGQLYDNDEDIQAANELADETQKVIEEGRAKVKGIISGQSKKLVVLTQNPIPSENKPKLDFIISILKNGKKDTPPGLSSSGGKYYKYLQKRYKKQLEDYKSKNPNATEEELDYEMLRLFSEEYEKMSEYAAYSEEEFKDLKKRSEPTYKGDDKILPGDDDYIPADAKQPTGDMQTIVMRTMEREDEFNGQRTEPVLTSNTLKDEYDKQTTALNNLREGMNNLKAGSGDDFFVGQMVERFHFGVSVGENPGGVPSNRFNLVMGRNASGIRYETQSDGSVKIFRKISGRKYEEIDENGNKIENGETRDSAKDQLETGGIATEGTPESIRHCLGLEENSSEDDLKNKITVDVITAGSTNQAEALIYNSEGKVIARQTIRSKTGPGGAIADTIQFEEPFQNCLQLYSYRKSKQS